jgi:hypothetical protein
MTMTATCASLVPALTIAGPTDAELNWNGWSGNSPGAAFGNVVDGLTAGKSYDITGPTKEGDVNFAYSTYATNFVVSGTIGFDLPGTHGSAGLADCSFWGTITSSS